MRSRREKGCPNTVNNGTVSPTSQAMAASNTKRCNSARKSPMRNAPCRWEAGSFAVTKVMNTRLSMPSTSSSRISVPRASQAVGSANQAKSQIMKSP